MEYKRTVNTHTYLPRSSLSAQQTRTNAATLTPLLSSLSPAWHSSSSLSSQQFSPPSTQPTTHEARERHNTTKLGFCMGEKRREQNGSQNKEGSSPSVRPSKNSQLAFSIPPEIRRGLASGTEGALDLSMEYERKGETSLREGQVGRGRPFLLLLRAGSFSPYNFISRVLKRLRLRETGKEGRDPSPSLLFLL